MKNLIFDQSAVCLQQSQSCMRKSFQLSLYFDDIFDQYICAFRKGHGCQTTLWILIEDWRGALDRNENVTAVLMALSNAFDCLPHEILLSKLSTYGLKNESVQQVKLNRIVFY